MTIRLTLLALLRRRPCWRSPPQARTQIHNRGTDGEERLAPYMPHGRSSPNSARFCRGWASTRTFRPCCTSTPKTLRTRSASAPRCWRRRENRHPRGDVQRPRRSPQGRHLAEGERDGVLFIAGNENGGKHGWLIQVRRRFRARRALPFSCRGADGRVPGRLGRHGDLQSPRRRRGRYRSAGHAEGGHGFSGQNEGAGGIVRQVSR